MSGEFSTNRLNQQGCGHSRVVSSDDVQDVLHSILLSEGLPVILDDS